MNADGSRAEEAFTPNCNSADEVLRTALDIGEHILESGGEISRVENTIERIGYSLGAVHVEAFAVTTLITASVRMADGSYSQQMRRVKDTEVNLYRVEELNRISRELCSGKINISEAQESISRVCHGHELKKWLIVLGRALICGGFVLFFGGTWRDALVSSVIGALMTLISGSQSNAFNAVSQTAARSFLAGVTSILCVRAGLGENADLIMIGTIMLLIPGLAVGTSIGDMLGKNIISGTMRLAQAIIQAVVIALGYSAAILLLGGAV